MFLHHLKDIVVWSSKLNINSLLRSFCKIIGFSWHQEKSGRRENFSDNRKFTSKLKLLVLKIS